MFDYTGPLSKVNELPSPGGARRFFSKPELARWDDPGWMKPDYSNWRLDVTGTCPEAVFARWKQARAFGRRNLAGAAAIANGGIKSAGWAAQLERERPRQVVRIRAYATDRIKMTSYISRSPVWLAAAKKQAERRADACSSKFISRYETRERFQAGGRVWVFPRHTTFPQEGKHMVLDAAHVLETYTDSRLNRAVYIDPKFEKPWKTLFGTFTIPGGTKEVFKATSLASGYIIERFTNWLRDNLQDGMYVWVWETQKKGRPHIHVMFRLNGDKYIQNFYRAARKFWNGLMDDVSDATGVDMWARAEGGTLRGSGTSAHVNFTPVKHTYAAYMSKYISKTKTKGGGKNGWWPGRWWGVSAALRSEVMLHRLDEIVEVEDAQEAQRFIKSACALGFSLFESQKVFEAKTDYAVDVYSFIAESGYGTSVASALVDWLRYGDYSPVWVIQDEREWSLRAPPRAA